MTGPLLRPLPVPQITWTRAADVVVVGAGAAGISAALQASAGGRRVLLICKAGLDAGSSPLAQGGLAAVLHPGDSGHLHSQDTVTAGAGLCDAAAVDALVAAAPGEIGWLRTLGARFDQGPLGLEGGHSRPRIVHAGGDASGAEIHRVLRAAVHDSGIEILDHTVALDLVLDNRGRVAGLLAGSLADLTAGVIESAAVVLASGGYGQAYATTTNPLGATGDGLALAARAGAELRDVEFVQFHPTVLWQAGGRGQQPLVTEALRGAGAALIDVRGNSVMNGRHPLGDLAPRDVVAAEMHRRMTTGDGPATHLWLDATGLGRQRLETHFPTVTSACRSRGIEPASEPIPVAPGAHYACGGISADMAGRTTLDGLYAVGEVAATGVHGANRLASNSLTEAIATGRALGRMLAADGPGDDNSDASGRAAACRSDVLPHGQGGVGGSGGVGGAGAGAGAAAGSRHDMAAAMSRYAGVVRDAAGLEHLLGLLAAVPPGAPGSRPGARLGLDTVEATNLHTVSTLVAVAAARRTESRGCHRRSDAPGARPGQAQRISFRWRDGEVDVRVAERGTLTGARA
jgi:L-aspartate oxidase